MRTKTKNGGKENGMRILLVTARMEPGGAETHIYELARELKRRENKVTVVSAGGKYAEMLKKQGIRHFTVPLWRRTDAPKAYPMLLRILRRGRFDVIHAHARYPAFLVSLARNAVDPSLPLVTTAHLQFRVDPVLRRLAVWGERTLAVSAPIRSYLIREYGVSPLAVENTVNGIDTDRFSPAPPDRTLLASLGLKENAPFRIGTVSRLDPDADTAANRLLSLFSVLAAAIPGAELVICGDGTDAEVFRRRAREINISLGRRAVVLTGGRTDVERVLRLFDLMVGVSRSAMEAMSCARPVLLLGPRGYLGVMSEAKRRRAEATNFCCLNASPTNEEITNDIYHIFTLSPEERAEMGAYNRSVILNRFTVRRMADDAMRAYRTVLGENGHEKRNDRQGLFSLN